MKKDELDIVFKNLEGCFDVHEAPAGHQKRFLDKLGEAESATSSKKSWWKPLSIAASIALLIAVGFSAFNTEETIDDLASVSPEMQQTQSFFVTTINQELATLKSYENADTKELIEDATKQLVKLENQYDLLKLDLKESGNDKRVIYAMITNFQNRIDLLQQVIETIEEIKTLKTATNETII